MEHTPELRLRFLEARLISAFDLIYEHDKEIREMRKKETK